MQGLPFFGPLLHADSRLVVYAPTADCGRTAADVLASTICPPLFPIGLEGFPGRIEVREPAASFRVGGFDVEATRIPHVGEALGYRVVVERQTGCCGRPAISKGMLPAAKAKARRNVDALLPYARRGVPIVGTEPSCLLTFRDDYPECLQDGPSKEIAPVAVLLDELLVRLAGEDPEGVAATFRRDATALGPAGTVAPFGLVFADPPYGQGLAEKALAAARAGGWLKAGALALVEDDAAAVPVAVSGFAPIDQREISGTRITFLQSTG